MDIRIRRHLAGLVVLAIGVIARVAAANAPSAGFVSSAPQLPNPDRPYEMTSGTVVFRSSPIFALYDLELAPSNSAQLDIPLPTPAGTWEFDSVFDVNYQAVVSFGTEPAHQVSGIGKAHMVGRAPAVKNFEPQVFDSELLSLNLYGLSFIPEMYFRESPTLASKGIIVREDTCPACASVLTRWRIASFFNVNAEFSYGGSTWTPGDKPFRIEQAPGPGAVGDYNTDGYVDGADFVALRHGLGSTYSQLDLVMWRANFGGSVNAGGATSLSMVPEPTAVLLAFAAMGASLRGRGRRFHNCRIRPQIFMAA